MDLMGVFDWHVVIFINTVYIYIYIYVVFHGCVGNSMNT